ncbi:MAG TPA: DHH family phosphoesterase [Candidatus Norongarragalinales archaeon]|jgi:RecJ-like exonuclease|nr:DHH family phosphoesterase [Candidatus Norongarragalinales archaeon]
MIPSDDTVRQLRKKAKQAAELTKDALRKGTPCVVRFNNDADGASSGMLVQRALQHFVEHEKIPQKLKLVRGLQANTSTYSHELAIKDAALAHDLGRKTVVICTDFAGNSESLQGMNEARESGIQIIVFDHHPCDAKLVAGACDALVDPFEFVQDAGASHYTTGLLTFLFLEEFKKPDKDDERLLKTSLYADVSRFAYGGKKPPEKEILKALMGHDAPGWLALDFLTFSTNDDTPLEYYWKDFKDEAKIKRLHDTATIGLKRAVEKAKPFDKVQQLPNGVELHVLNLDKVLIKKKWPPRGHFLTAFYLSQSEGAPAVAIGYGNDGRASFRATEKALKLGFDASRIIAKLKKEFPHAILSGGGHPPAAAFATNTLHFQQVLERTIELSGNS